ncbi:2Fe-2S iron-sulfur cluster binding domain-containing protein [Nitrospirales bacterium NOB]|nr:2Fe-2S iron-sulfur cluster binding domain-containing protein [Nitrospirales bacterium NOB]
MTLVRFTMDDREISAPAGTLVIEAAKKAGIEIPSFCYYPGLKLQGACRMCLVEVEKMPKLQTACTLSVMEGMIVRTDTAQVREARQAMLEFVLTNHPMDCPVCDKGGECELQDATFAYGAGEGRFVEIKQHRDEQQWSPVVYFDRPRCILCYRCVRICDEGMGVSALAVAERACPTTIIPNRGDHLDCDECGMCIDICPVGALTSGMYRYQTRPWEMKHVGTICTHCGDGCKTTLGVRNNEVVRGTNRDRSGINGEFLCIKGRYASDFNHHSERLRKPLIRVEDRFESVSWGEAILAVANRFREGLSRSDQFGVIGSTRTTNEENYYLRRFVREGLKSKSLDHHRTGDLIGLTTALRGKLDAMATSADLYTASAVLVIGSDLAQEHPFLSYQIRANRRHHGGRVYVITPGPVREDDIATASVRVQSGGELEAVQSLASQIRQERDLVILFGGSIRGNLLNQIVEISDSFEIPVKFVCLMDYSNSRGAIDMGLLPGAGGLSLTDMLSSDQLDVLWVVGANPLKSHRLNARRPYLVVQDLFLTETAKAADVVLPAASVYEKRGTVTNTCGEVQLLSQSLSSEGAKSDLEIFSLLSRALGMTLCKPDPESVLSEIRSTVPGYNLPLERLRQGEAIQTRLAGFWPDQVWDSSMIEPAHNTLFTSGSLGRYSKVLGDVKESPGSLYNWSRLGLQSSGILAGDAMSENRV